MRLRATRCSKAPTGITHTVIAASVLTFAAASQVQAAGDWCLGARIEAAYLSGQAAAGRVLSHPAGETRAAEAGQPAHTANAKSVGG